MIRPTAGTSPLVPHLGAMVKEEKEGVARRGGQTVAGRFSQQVRPCATTHSVGAACTHCFNSVVERLQ